MWRPVLLAAVLARHAGAAPAQAPGETRDPAAANAAVAPAEEPWASLSGSGLLTLPDTSTLAPGRFVVAVTVDNRDRDPLGLDILDGSVAWTLGLARRAEAYGHAVLSRVAALPELPPLPPPPLDLVVAPGAAAPPRPHYALYSPVPYVNKRGTARFDDWVAGDAVVGVKLRLREPHRLRPGLAVAVEVKAPLTRDLLDLQSGSGTGGVDVGGRVIAEWRAAGWDLLASAGYVRTGRPPFGDRVIAVPAPGEARIMEAPLDLPDRLELGAGVRRRLGRRLAGVLEASTVVEVGGRTPVVDAARPVDVLAGLQGRWGRLRVTACLRYHGHALPSGARRTSPVGGLLDLTGVAESELAAFLGAVGAGSALPALRPGSQRLLALPGAPPPLPEGARVIPYTYEIRSEHQVGFVLLWGWVF